MRVTTIVNTVLTAGVPIMLAWTLLGCSNTYPDCDNDNECAAYGQSADFCIDGVCRACRADTNCGFGQECRNTTCVAVAGFCGSSSDCGPGQVCRNNQCRAGCDDDSACGVGSLCMEGQCVAATCRTDGDCPSGNDCVNRRCVAAVACADRALESVYFDFDESRIRTDQETQLAHNTTCLSTFPNDRVTIEGHCDDRGTDAYNLALGEQRARAVKRYLEQRGIVGDRLVTISYGETRPVAHCQAESCWSRNRRAAFGWRQ